MEKMTFTTDRTSLVEGEVITIEWDCLDAERVELSIDNGYKASVVQSFSKTIKVRVHEMPTTHAETVGDDYAQRPPKRGLAAKWQELQLRWQMAWQAMTPDKKVASRVLMIIAATLLLCLVVPRLLIFGILVVVAYLVWYIRKK